MVKVGGVVGGDEQRIAWRSLKSVDVGVCDCVA
jgi:hypothetical protein